MKMHRMGRKLRHTKGTTQHRKKDAKKGARKLDKTKNNKAKKKGKGKKKNAKKKRLREKEKLKKERDRKKLQRIRNKKKKKKIQKQKQQAKRKQKHEEKKKQQQKEKEKKKLKSSKNRRRRKTKRKTIEETNISKKRTKAAQRDEKQWSKKEKQLVKMWKDWLPLPSASMQSLLRERMDACNWGDFSGHSNSTNLIPRSDHPQDGIIEIWAPFLNPFDISAKDEAREFEDDLGEERGDVSLEMKFDRLDVALYDVEADPEERTDLREELPVVFADLRQRALFHLTNVVPEDFPAQEQAGHPRNFGGVFSPGWCQPKYL